MLIGRFGPDVGIGEQGTIYRYSNPLTGQNFTYSSTGIGLGLGGPFLGYGGMFSPVAGASYGPFAFGQIPIVGPTPGYDTTGYISGNLWGQNTSFYQARINPFAAVLFGGLGGFSGFGLNSYFGYPSFGRVGFENERSFLDRDKDVSYWYGDDLGITFQHKVVKGSVGIM